MSCYQLHRLQRSADPESLLWSGCWTGVPGLVSEWWWDSPTLGVFQKQFPISVLFVKWWSLSEYRELPGYPHHWHQDRCEYQKSRQHEATSEDHVRALNQMFGASAPGSSSHRSLFLLLGCRVVPFLLAVPSGHFDSLRWNTAHDKHSCGRGGAVERVQILQSCDLTPPGQFCRRSVSLNTQLSRLGPKWPRGGSCWSQIFRLWFLFASSANGLFLLFRCRRHIQSSVIGRERDRGKSNPWIRLSKCSAGCSRRPPAHFLCWKFTAFIHFLHFGCWAGKNMWSSTAKLFRTLKLNVLPEDVQPKGFS